MENKKLNRYRVYGHTTVVVTIEVNAESESEAYKEAWNQLDCLKTYAGNGGLDKLIGVSGENETVDVFEGIKYDDVELLEQKEKPCGTCKNRGWETTDAVAACNCCDAPDYEFYVKTLETEE